MRLKILGPLQVQGFNGAQSQGIGLQDVGLGLEIDVGIESVGGAAGAAARMGIKRTTLISRMKKLGIDPRAVS